MLAHAGSSLTSSAAGASPLTAGKTSMVTAGALQRLDKAMGFDSTQTAMDQMGTGSLANNGIATSPAANQFQQNLLKNVTNNLAGEVGPLDA